MKNYRAKSVRNEANSVRLKIFQSSHHLGFLCCAMGMCHWKSLCCITVTGRASVMSLGRLVM